MGHRGIILLFPILMGLVGWLALKDGRTSSTAQPPHAAPLTATSTIVLLAQPTPSQDRDELWLFAVEQGTLVVTSTPAGWRIPMPDAGKLTRESEEAAWAWEYQGERVVLRNRRGNAYLDPRLIGMASETHAAVVATDSDKRVLLTLARNGSLQELQALSEQTTVVHAGQGQIWLVETAPQDGIETPPQGPSKVWWLDLQGRSSPVYVDDRTIDITP